MASNITLCAFARVLAAKGKHVTTVAAPIRADIGKGLETVRDTMVDLLCIVVLKRKDVSETPRQDLCSRHTPIFDFDIHFVTTFW